MGVKEFLFVARIHKLLAIRIGEFKCPLRSVPVILRECSGQERQS